MLFEEISNIKHKRHHLLVDRSPQLLLARVNQILHIAKEKVGKLSAQPYGGNMPSSHGKQVLEVCIHWPGSRIQPKMKAAHAMLHPESAERWRRTYHKHIKDATCSAQR
jgi:hypothetical protein